MLGDEYGVCRELLATRENRLGLELQLATVAHQALVQNDAAAAGSIDWLPALMRTQMSLAEDKDRTALGLPTRCDVLDRSRDVALAQLVLSDCPDPLAEWQAIDARSEARASTV
jgi:hypothetical protein